MVDTAGTLCLAAKSLKESGARKIIASCTHPILSGEAISRIIQSPITRLLVGDTIPVQDSKMIDKISVHTSASLFGEAIRRIHNEQYISSLFDTR